MTITIRAQTPPAAPSYSLANVSVTNNNGISPLKMSLDCLTLYGYRVSDNTLMQSQDKGATWSAIHTFANPLTGMIEMANGECLVLCTASAQYPGYVFKSSGWSTTPANRPSATWTQTLSSPGGQLQGKWTGHKWSSGTNGVVIISTYGQQTVSGGAGANTNTAHYSYISQDFGSTFSPLFDLYTQGGANPAVGVHFHCSLYSEPDDRIWMSYGDQTGDGYKVSGSPTTKQQLMYSDDRGATWTWANIPADYSQFQSGNAMQFVTLGLAADGSLILLPDGAPYHICIWNRTGYRTFGNFHTGPQMGPGGTSTIGSFLNRDNSNGPWIATFELNSASLSVNSDYRSVVIYMSVDGKSWHSAYVDYQHRIAGTEYYTLNLMGPTPDGKVVGQYSYKNGGAWANGALFVADLVGPA